MSGPLAFHPHAFDGSAGAQHSFLDECWTCAHLAGSGAHGSARAHGTADAGLRSCAPKRSQEARERNKPDDTGNSVLRSCAPKECTEGDWAGDARKLLATCPESGLRSDLTDEYEETAATLEYDHGLSRAEAEMQAFGLLLFEILRRGIGQQKASP